MITLFVLMHKTLESKESIVLNLGQIGQSYANKIEKGEFFFLIRMLKKKKNHG